MERPRWKGRASNHEFQLRLHKRALEILAGYQVQHMQQEGQMLSILLKISIQEAMKMEHGSLYRWHISATDIVTSAI